MGQGLLHPHRRDTIRRVKPLEHPDSLHLQAAEGWLDLGNCAEASKELEQITPHLRSHPDVLKVRLGIHLMARDWQDAATVTDTLADMLPEDPEFWQQRAVALCQLGRLQEARAALMIAFDLDTGTKRKLAALNDPDLEPLWQRYGRQ